MAQSLFLAYISNNFYDEICDAVSGFMLGHLDLLEGYNDLGYGISDAEVGGLSFKLQRFLEAKGDSFVFRFVVEMDLSADVYFDRQDFERKDLPAP